MTISEIQQKMEESDSSVQTLQFDFDQQMQSALTEEIRHSSGTAYFKKPKLFRIEQKEPELQSVVSTGKSVFIYTPRFRQVLKQSWKDWTQTNRLFVGLTSFSNTFSKLKQDYRWEILENAEIRGEETVAVLLKPLDKTGQGHTLKIWVSVSDFLPRKTQLREGTITLETTLSLLRKNSDLKPQLFDFKKPKDVELIETR